jgi:hypothetical protein
MASTMLALIQQATAEMSLAVPTTVAGSTVQDVIQQFALLNAVGYEVQRKHQWEALCTEYRFTTAYVNQTGTTTAGSAIVTGLSTTTDIVAGTWMVTGTGINQDVYVVSVDSASQVTLSQACLFTGDANLNFSQTKYPFPADFDRIINRTQYDKSKHWEMLGPSSPQQWQWLKSAYISTGPRIRFRPMGGYLQIWPPMSTAEYLGFEYLSKYWAINGTTGAPQAAFVNDNDTCIFPDRLMVLGLKRKYFEIKGFDTSRFDRDYEQEYDLARSHDAGAPTLSQSPRMSSILIGWENIPDSGFGS